MAEKRHEETSYDFLTWTSFPSSAKLLTYELYQRVPWWLPKVAVVPGKRIRAEFNAKVENVKLDAMSHLLFQNVINGVVNNWFVAFIPYATRDWAPYSHEETVPVGVDTITPWLAGGMATSPDLPAVTWFDDLKIYQDDTLIYTNDFSNWSPVIGAGIGAPIGGVTGYLLKEPLGPMVSEVVGAIVGGALGGGIGLLTGLGIIPVPQIPIPSLGAAPEGPGAPARLGKYQITG